MWLLHWSTPHGRLKTGAATRPHLLCHTMSYPAAQHQTRHLRAITRKGSEMKHKKQCARREPDLRSNQRKESYQRSSWTWIEGQRTHAMTCLVLRQAHGPHWRHLHHHCCLRLHSTTTERALSVTCSHVHYTSWGSTSDKHTFWNWDSDNAFFTTKRQSKFQRVRGELYSVIRDLEHSKPVCDQVSNRRQCVHSSFALEQGSSKRRLVCTTTRGP